MGLRSKLPTRSQISRWVIYTLFAGIFISLPTSVPAARAAAIPPSTPSVTLDSNGCPVGWLYDSTESRCSKTWSYTNTTDTFTTPSGITYLDVDVKGAQGGRGGNDSSRTGANSSPGGYVRGTIRVASNQSLVIAVGGAGTNGPSGVGGYGYWRATAAGVNPLTGYDGGSGGSSSIYGTSGAGGGGGAATVLQVGESLIVAAGSGGGGGAGLNNAASGTSTVSLVASATSGTGGSWGSYNESCGGGGGGGGGGGFRGGNGGGIPGCADQAGFSGSSGSNSDGGFSALTTGYETATAGSVTLSYFTDLRVMINETSTTLTNSETVTFNIGFNYSIDPSTLTTNDFTFSGTATGCQVSALSGSGMDYAVSVTGCSEGTVALNLPLGTVTTASDSSVPTITQGTSGPRALSTSNFVTIDRTPPVATLTEATVRPTGTFTGRSTETGTLYLVHSSVTVTSLNSITSNPDRLWNTVSAPTANTNVTIPSTGLDFGDYKLYAIDQAGNLSALDTETARYWPTQATVTYHLNGANTGSVPPTTVTQETTTVQLRTNTGNMVKTGSTLVGWNTLQAGGFATRYLLGDSYIASANITLYAEWVATCAPITSYANGDQILTITRTTPCAYTLPDSATAMDILVVGGGGGGGANVGSGGGGGGVTYQTAVPVIAGQVVVVSNGAGGAAGAVGSASTLTVGKVQIAAGGGALGPTWSSGRTCGSPRPAGGTGLIAGGRGGNGAGANPQAGCIGESGTTLSISGTPTIYGAGGGGGGYALAGGLAGGGIANNGGGNGGGPSVAGGAAIDNRGGGGGGGGSGNAAGGAGGDGVTIIALDFLATVTFDTNTAASGAPGAATLSQGATGESVTAPTQGTLSKPGFRFDGWNTAADGSGTDVEVGDPFTPQGNTRLYAEWNYDVIYDGNGHTSGTVADSVTVKSSISTITLDSATALARTGYTLTGWNTLANGSGTNYALGATNWKSAAGDITLYAQWSSTISFSLNDADTGTVPSAVVTTGTGNGTFNLPSPTNFRKAGLTFAGWNTAANGTGTSYAPGASYTSTGTATLFAQFNASLTYLANGATSGTAPSQVVSPFNANSDGCKIEIGYTHCRTYKFPAPAKPVTSMITLNLDASNTATMNGTSWYDTTQSGIVATAVNAPTYDPVERAWTLNGTNQYFNLGNVLNYTSGAYTIEVTFKPASLSGTQTLLSRYNANVAGNYYTQIVNGKVRYSHEATPYTFDGPSSLSTGQKYVATQVFNGSALTGYLNGVQNGSPVAFAATYASTVNLLVGAILNSNSPIQFFNGKIYSVRIYGKALSAAEIDQNYQVITNSPPTNFNQTFEVPGNIAAGERILVEAWGGGGGGVYYNGYTTSGAGGAGGYSKSTVTASGNPETWTVMVGQGGEAYDLTPQYGGGGAGGLSPAAYKGSSGGGMSAIFAGTDTSTPIIIVGGGGGSSPAGASVDGGGGGAGYGTGGATTYANRSGRGGTLLAGGAAATQVSSVCSIAPTAGRSQQGGNGAGHPTSTNSEGGGGGGGGYFGGGGGHCDGTQSNGGGGGGSGYANLARVSIIDSATGASGIVTPATSPGGTNSPNYSFTFANANDPAIGVGFGGNGNSSNFIWAKGGDGLIVIHWTDPSDSWIASANVNSMERTGFTFGGWNTKADGTGVHYDTGTALARVNTTLYAEWRYTIRYDGNTNTSGTPPADQIALSPGAVTTIADNPNTLEKTGYIWDGWNGAADGKGQNYTATGDLYGLPKSYMRFKASDYNTSTKVWIDSSGNGRNSSLTRGAPAKTTSAGAYGLSKTFTTLKGATTDGIRFANPQLANYTLCYVARYAGANRGRLIDTVSGNWASGFYGNRTDMALHDAWVTSTNGRYDDLTWQINCDSGDTFRSEGVALNTATSTTKYLPAELSVGYGLYSGSNEKSDWEVAELILFDSYLTTTQMQQIETYFADTYGYTPYDRANPVAGAFMQLEATNFNTDTRVWEDSSGNNRDVNSYKGVPTVVTKSPGDGSSKNVTVLKGGPSAGVNLNNPQLANYTFCYVARYAGTNKWRIFDAFGENWLTGFYSGGTNLAYHTGTWTAATGALTTTNWVYACDSPNDYVGNVGSRAVAATTINYLPANITINNGASRASESSDWEVAEVIIYDRVLSNPQINQVNGYFVNKYGLWAPAITTKRNTNFASPAGDVTLYAQWNSYITYDSNTATSGTVPLPTLMVADTAVALSANVGYLARTGNSFLGWNTQANGLGVSYAVNETYTPTANITLFAQWGSRVTFDSNTATSGAVPSASTIAMGSTLTLASGTIAKTGYTFAGWNTLANGSGTRYETGTVFTPTQNITLFAQWNSLIRFDVNGATGAPNVDSVTATGTVNVTLATRGNMVRTGYEFGGWTTGSNGTGSLYAAGLTTYAPAGNIILYAKWTGLPFTVTFNGNSNTGGSTASKSITGGTAAALTANGFLRTGYGFIGWSDTNTATTATYANGSSQTFFGNTTLYAVWKPDVYTITYSSNTALGSANKVSETYTVGTTGVTLALVGTMAKQGYRFTGWATSSTGTTALTSPYVATASITLFAIWTPNQYRLLYDSNTATSGTLASILFTAGSSFNLNGLLNFQKTGFTQTSWNTKADGTGTPYAGGGSVTAFDTTTVFAQWSPNAPAAPTVSVAAGNTTATISVNGGTLGASNGPADSYTVVAKIGTTTIGSCIVVSPATSCTITGLTNNTAYTFTATATNKTGTSAASTGVAGTPRGFVVTYNPMSGTVSPTSATFNTGSPLTFPLPTRNGYNFLGWFDTSTAGNNLGLNGGSYSPSESRTVFARWSAIPFTISYFGNGNTSGAIPANGTYSLTSGNYAIADKNTLAKTGYTFSGWRSDTGTVFTVGANYATLANLNLYANWVAEPYTVTYSANGGTGSVPVKPGTVTIGETFTAASTSITLAGSTFAGWSDGNRTYLPGEVITVGGLNITLSAVWNGTQYVVIYSLNGGTGSGPTSPNFFMNDTFTVESIGSVTKNGFTFSGWVESGTAYASGSTFTMPSRNINFIAQWAGLVYTITYATTGATSGTPTRTSDSFTFGSNPISLPTAGSMVKAGYSFAGWKETSTVISSSYAPTATVTLQPAWTANTQTFTFNANGATGTAPATASYTTDGTVVTAPGAGNLAKAGFTFGGWSDGTNTYPEGSAITGTSNKTLNAIWTPATFAIIYAVGTANGVAVTAPIGLPSTAATAYGSSFTLGTPETRTVTENSLVYAFAGWTSNGQTYQAGASVVMGTSSPTFTASWLRLYEVRYFMSGGVDTGMTQGALYSDGALVTIDAAIPTRVGYTFAGWNDQSGNAVSGNTYSISATNYLFYARWTVNNYTLAYDSAGGSTAPAAQTSAFGSVINLPSSTSVTKAGYVFAGWLVGGNTVSAGSQYQFGALSETATALWSATSQSITFDLAQGTSNTPISEPSKNIGETFAAPTVTPSRTGYTFTGWSDGSTNYAPGATVTMGANNITLTAQWSVTSYVIRYELNGGTGSIPSPTSFNFGATHTIAAGVTKANSNFIGWSNGANTYSVGASFTLSARDETFTAQFSGAIYALSFSLNGADTGTVPSTITGQITDDFILPSSTGLAKTGYGFGGWTDGVTTYTAGQTITGVNANTTLTAIWNLLPPAALSAPVATPGDHAGTITVTPPSLATGGPVTSYKIVATDSTGTPLSPEKSCLVNAPATSCTITGLTNGTTYKFIATATNAAGSTTSAPSNTIVPASIPGPPTTVTATRGDETATVTFAAPADNGGSAITSYTLTVVETGQTFTGSGSPITVTGLTNGSSYTFKVMATNAVGNSDSSTASAPIKIAGVADAPTSVTAVAGDETATVSASGNWNTISGSGGESVTAIVFTSMNGLHTCTATSPATSCVMTGLTNGTAYTFTAVAQNVVGNSPTATSNSVTPAGTPTAPTTVSAVAGDRSATITFSGAGSNGSAITGYIIKISPSGDTVTVSSSPATITGLTNGGSYSFTVAAINALGESEFSSTSASATPASAPGAPTSLSVLAGDTSTVVSWSPPADDGGSPITSYLITASNGATCTAVVPATSCKISGLTNGTSYTFTAKAINDIGTGVASANSPAAVPAGLPTPPTSISAAIGNGQVSISFSGAGNNGSAITNYTVIAEPGGFTGTSSSSPVTVLGLTNGTAYTFRVIATNSVGDSESSTVTTTATPATVPDAPTSSSASGGNRSAQVSWTAPTDNGGAPITSYTVTASPGGATCTAAANLTSCFVGGLTNGSTYSFTVVANNAVGGSTASGSSNSVTPLGPPSAPTITEVVRGDTKTTISFNAPTSDGGTSITQYVITAQPGGLSITTSSTVAEFTGLTNGVAYTFTVAAENGVGRGTNSNGVVATPAGIPTAPTVITGTPGNRSVNIEFSGATGNGATITGYIITAVETGETRTTTSSPIRFGSLTNGDPYTFTVVTVTSVGESSPSQASTAVIPEQVSNVSTSPSSPAPSGGGSFPLAPTPTPTPNPSASPTPNPSASPTPNPSASPTPTAKPSPTPSPSPSATRSPSPTPSPKPSVKPKPTSSAGPKTSPSPKASPMPSPSTSKKVTINPKTAGSSSKVGIENLKPGQKIKVTVVEGKSIPSKSATPSPKTTSKATPKPVAPKNGFKTTTKAPVKVVPKPSGTKAAVGIENLKPGQKIKVTVKTGGTNK